MSESQSQTLTRYALTVEGIATEQDARDLQAALAEVPGLESPEVDRETGEVEFVADSRRAVGDARWIAEHRGYEAH